MNEYFKKNLTNRIHKALMDSETASGIEHPYLSGKLREIVLHQLIEPLLNRQYSIGTGKIIDYRGEQSKEVDLCMYSNNLLPPFFFSEKDSLGIFPIESVLGCIEVKTTLNKITLEDAYTKFKFIEDNLQTTGGFHDVNENPMAHIFVKPKYSVFAFRTDTKYTPESILKLYSKIDPDWNDNPLITSICLANNGWICYTIKGWLHMPFNEQTKVNEEIIGFLCATIHDLPRTEHNRGIPRIGYYLSDPSTMGRFRNGKLVKRPWKRALITDFYTTPIKHPLDS